MGYETGIAHFFYPQNMAHEMGHEDFYDSDFVEKGTLILRSDRIYQ